MLKSVCGVKECILIHQIIIDKHEKALAQIRMLISLKYKKYAVNYINNTSYGIQYTISGYL